MELPLLLVVDLPSGSVTTLKVKEAVFPAKESVLGNQLKILLLLIVLTESINMVFSPKCRLRPILASSWDGTERVLIYKKTKKYRASSERSNSTCKGNDLDILERPRVREIKRAAVLSYLSDIASLLKGVFGLIVRVTVNLRKYRETKDKKYWKRLFSPKVPLYLLYTVQRE